jgi:hypothetical protein
VLEEFEESRKHYEKLGLGERMEMDLHEGGHEARVESGVRFLRRWLMQEMPQAAASSLDGRKVE